MEFRLATITDMDQIMDIIADARAFLKEQGLEQWQGDYPTKEIFINDINKQEAYVMSEGDDVIAYVCVSFDGEECYEQINGEWLSTLDYALIHRLAMSRKHKGKGISSKIFKHIEELCINNGIRSIKVDTFESNKIVRHILETKDFKYCGTVYSDNCERIAFEKLLDY